MRMNRRSCALGARRQSGFSMIEVLVAVLVLALGLLGFALLQTMNLRFTQSANYRTEATNLAYDLLDQMRANRFQAGQYSGASGADFAPNSLAYAPCTRPVAAAATIAANITRWQCQVVEALGPTAGAGVTYADGVVQVTITWGDQRWDAQNPNEATSFVVSTRL